MSDDEKDSLFGSPPPSPSVRGRSPSLALPELPTAPAEGLESLQNVGTIALPGSHKRFSELPVFLNPALPSVKPPALSLRPPAKSAPRCAPPTRPHVAGSTLHRTRSPTRQHPPAVHKHTAKTDRTLRDLVGLISHFEPSLNPPPPKPPGTVPTRGPVSRTEQHSLGTAQNPIEVDALPDNLPRPTTVQSIGVGQGPADAVNSALVALAGTVASALKLPPAPKDAPSLPKPTVNNVLQLIKNDPNLIPVLQATYEYLGSVSKQAAQPPRTFSNVTTNDPNPSSKRRRNAMDKGSQVPAGAGHWGIPFPFAPGEGPKDYPSQWQLERGRRVLGDLLGLFERAFARARGDPTGGTTATKKSRPRKRRRTSPPGSSAPSAPTVRSESGGPANGSRDQGYAPSGSQDTPLDDTRMNEWLSSVPAVENSSIVESTGPMPSPSPSDPAPASDNLHDLLGLFGSCSGDPSVTPADDTNNYSFDFDATFGDVGLSPDDAQCRSLFGPGSVSQSINDMTAFPMGFGADPLSQPATFQSQSQLPQLPEFAIDPVLMALNQPPAASSSQISVLDSVSTEKVSSTDLDFLSSDALLSLLGPTALSQITNSETTGIGLCSSGSGNAEEHILSDARSNLTAPTIISTSPSQAESRHASVAPTDVDVPSVVSPTSSSQLSKAQRRVALLAKARELRARLLKAIEETKTEFWETTIEGGVLMNLLKADIS